jgi:hypothetical protein
VVGEGLGDEVDRVAPGDLVGKAGGVVADDWVVEAVLVLDLLVAPAAILAGCSRG